MNIQSSFVNRSGQTLTVEYYDCDSVSDIQEEVDHVHAYCFYNNQLVVVYAQDKNYWTFPGGSIEKGESVEEAVIREVLEESNMKVLSQQLLGYQNIYEPDRVVVQTRSVCIVEPYGDFISDPDGDITEVKLIDPSDYQQYVDWSIIGDHLAQRVFTHL